MIGPLSSVLGAAVFLVSYSAIYLLILRRANGAPHEWPWYAGQWQAVTISAVGGFVILGAVLLGLHLAP